MTRIDLPGPGATPADLVALANQLGDPTIYNLIRGCRVAQGAGNDPAGETLTILAQRMVDAEIRATGADHTTAAAEVATRLGYTPTGQGRTISNFTRVLARPVTDGGDRALLNLAAEHGDAAAYRFITLCRTVRGDQDSARETLTILAQRMVATEQRLHDLDYDTARRNVADRLGYTPPRDGNGRANFYNILKGGRPPEQRPRRSPRPRRTR